MSELVVVRTARTTAAYRRGTVQRIMGRLPAGRATPVAVD